MEQLPTIIDRYLHLIQEILINSNYQDRATDPWSPPVFDTLKRDRGLDWPQQGLTMIGRIRLNSLRECCELAVREQIPGDFVETGIWRGGACIMMAAVLATCGETQAMSGASIPSKGCCHRMRESTRLTEAINFIGFLNWQ